MKIDASTWDKRNLWIDQSGNLAVRPGLRRFITFSGRKVVGGFSVRNPATAEMVHYVVSVSTSGALAARLDVYDFTWTLFQRLTLNCDREPRAITGVALGSKVFISSPDFAPLFGYVGSGLVPAKKLASKNPATTALTIPRGVATRWNNRAVIAVDGALYFSDPNEPQTYIPQNIDRQWPGYIYGVFQAGRNDLAVVTSDALYLYPGDAAAAGQVVARELAMKATDYTGGSFETVCSVRGAVWGLTRRGMRRLYPEGPEIQLSDQPMTRYFGPRIDFEDYRNGRIFGGQNGPIVSIGDYTFVYDERHSFGSWWDSATGSLAVRGLLQLGEGEEAFLAEGYAAAIRGNFDGTTASDDATQPHGVLAGAIRLPPGDSRNLEAVHVSSDTPGDLVCAHYGTAQTSAVPQRSIRIAYQSWGDGNYFREPNLRSRRFRWNQERFDEIGIEVAAEGCLSRLNPEIEVELSDGPGVRRPTT